VSFQVAQSDNRRTLDVQQIGQLITQLRAALEQSQLSPDELRRAERHLTAIEEEARSDKPLLSEITDGITFLGKLAQTAQGLAPLFSSTYQLLAAAVG
jgi:DNA topoisomerase IA